MGQPLRTTSVPLSLGPSPLQPSTPKGGEAGGAGGKQLKLSLLKKEPQGPFWPCLVRGHPEVETSGMKKAEMSTEQLMEQLGALGGAPGMMGGMGAGGMEAMMNAMGGGSGDMEGFSG